MAVPRGSWAPDEGARLPCLVACKCGWRSTSPCRYCHALLPCGRPSPLTHHHRCHPPARPSQVAGRFDPATFSPEVVDAAARLVPATMALWARVQARMLPTPAKFHYLFNMRDLSKARAGAGLHRTAL